MDKNPNQNKKHPLVSIIIPFYNREKFLGEAIESVLIQNVSDWELLLIDDGSTDNSVEVVKKYIEEYPEKIYLFSHQDNKNKGASPSRKLGLNHAKGKFISFLDSDDIYLENTLEREIKAFEENTKADAVCGTAECWYSWSDNAKKNEKDFIIDLVLETEKLYQPPDLFIHNMKAGGRKSPTNSMMLKRRFAEKIKMFSETYNVAWEDQIWWAKMTLNGNIYVMDAVLSKYRLHSDSISSIESQNAFEFVSIKIFLEWLNKYLKKQNIQNKDVWNSFKGFQRKVYLEGKLWKLKNLYRNFLPLHIRYKIRDILTKTKQKLLWSSHWHK